MRLLAKLVPLVSILNLLPIGISQAQDDAVDKQLPSNPFGQDLDKETEPQEEPPAIDSDQSESSTGDEIIVDPELSAIAPKQQIVQDLDKETEPQEEPPAIDTNQSESLTSDELIVDPELSAIAPRQQTDSVFSGVGESCPPAGEVKVLLRSRFATDLEWEEREEVWEANQLFLIETNLRTSERLRFSAGIRLHHQFAALESDTTEAESTRFRFDAMPTAGFADATLTDGLHLRAGFQMIQLGPMNVFSATNFLTATDLRDGPTVMPEAAEIAQLALRVDADPVSWLSLRAVYLPFYQPHLVSSTESDYAQFPASRVEEVFQWAILAPGEDPQGDEIRQFYKETVSRSARSQTLDAGNVMFFPEPDFTDPQGGIRAVAHGPEGEVGITLGTAIERLPASYMPPDLIRTIRDTPGELTGDEDLSVQVFYSRFYLFAFDASTDVGPIRFGVETSYHVDRTMLSVTKDIWPRDLSYYEALLQDGAWPVPGKTDLLQFTLNGEFLQGSEWMVALEGLYIYSLHVPYEPDREWQSLYRGRSIIGSAALIRWTPWDDEWTFELTSLVTNGLNYIVAPRIEARLVYELYAELGAFLVGASSPSGEYIDQEIITGYLYEGNDQIFVGLRWLP